MFRRSYADHMHWEEAGIDSLYFIDPQIIEPFSVNKLYNRLIELGFVHNHQLVLSKFDTSGVVYFHSSTGDLKANIDVDHASDERRWRVNIGNGKNAACIYLPYDGDKLSLAEADIIPGGFKELIVLKNWYMMVGDNFDIYLYEIKSK